MVRTRSQSNVYMKRCTHQVYARHALSNPPLLLGRIPSITDTLPDGTEIRVFESGSIMQYVHIHLGHSQDRSSGYHDRASGCESLELAVSLQIMSTVIDTEITRYLVDSYDTDHTLSYPRGSKEFIEVYMRNGKCARSSLSMKADQQLAVLPKCR